MTSQRGFLDFSPLKKDDGNKENDVPVLTLVQFSKAPFVSFGPVRLGSARARVLRVDNPTDDAVAEVTIDKISSSKGFSADHNRFIVQPGSSFTLTITWTPAEEGGIRELIVFNANGLFKHQAVLLGRAEAPKKKKKSLWDSIKNKRAANPTETPRCKNNESTLKITANRTFQVPRKPQYKRGKPRSPLALLNERVAIRERSLSKPKSVEDGREHQRPHKAAQRPKGLAGSDHAQIRHAQENTPVLLLAPGAELADLSNGSAVPLDLLGTPEHPGLTRVLNRTLSPVGTPEGFKRLMPRIQSLDSPVIEAFPAGADKNVRGPPVDSDPQRLAPARTVSEALALIDSDLHTLSAHSSCDIFSGSPCPGPVKLSLDVIPDSPDLSECNGQRCTFFVSKNTTASHGVVGPMMESVHTNQEVKKTSFTSATVTKSKAAVAAPNVFSPGGRRIRKSRRRLLEKTRELSESSSQCESSPGLPVIDSDNGAESWPRHCRATSSPHSPPTAVLFPITSLLDRSPAPTPPSFTATSLSPVPPSSHAFPTFFPHLSCPVSVPLMFNESSPPAGFPLSPVCSKTSEVLLDVSNPAGSPPPPGAASSQPLPPSPPLSQEVLKFPVHTKAQLDRAKSKKRKSDEYLRGVERAEDVARLDLVKRSRVVVTAATTHESMKSVHEKKRAVERPQRQHNSAGSVRSTVAPSMKKIARVVAPATSQSTLRGARSLKAFGAGPIRTAKVVAVAQAKLTFIKPAQTAIPRHPMPFAAKNMFYDERWIEKQESGFTCWINYILTPDDFKVNLEVTKVNALSIAMGSDEKYSVPKAPTKEELSFSTYTARRRLNRLRRSACQLFTSEVMVKAIQRLELEVEAKRLLVRKDRHLWKDIGERQKVLNWLLLYNPLWLRIGLETIYGELIPLESNSDVLGLAMFILTRLLWNPDIATEFRHAKVPHLYKDGHEEALSRFTLKKLLLLVCFLDKAKESRLIEHDPCLFCMDAEFKTSKDLLLAFSRDFLSGEGILPRHMGYLGLPVSHVQTPLDEFNFAVKNLSVDLKCGIRLVRVMELFLQDWSLSRRLRLPAISRLQKVHNVDITFQVLKAKGVDLRDEHGSTIDSRDIVDGHREKTLSLLWKIIFAFQVEVILDEDQLREEIGFLKRTLRTKRRLASLRADRGPQEAAGRAPAPGPFETSSTKIGLLMEWVNAVCDYYNLRVENFTVSFSDGRVLCYLIHHYHPGSLPEQAISHSTTQTVDCSSQGRVELDCSDSDSDSSFNFQPSVQKGLESPSFEFKELLEKEKNNFRLVNSAVMFLGGVPAMLNPTDMSNTIPNEKVVTSYLSFLCSRLLDLRNEARAARVIQGAWRKYRLMKDLELYQQRNVAAAKIQVFVKSFLQRCRAEREKSAAILIQARWRGYAARNSLRIKREAQLWALRHNAAMIIQAWWKMYSVKRSYQCLRYHVVIVQAQWRMRRAAISYNKIHSAATVIQTYTRAWAMARRERGRYISLRTAAVQIQRGYRRWRALRLSREHRAAIVIQTAFRKWHVENVTQRAAAALKIQSWYRMRRCVLQYLTLRRSAVLIQAHFRGRVQRCSLQTLMLQQRSALVIQSAFRGQAVRKHLAKKRRAAVLLQRWFRACVKRNLERHSFVTLRHAAVIIQAAHRGNAARVFLREQCHAATVIQAAFRRFAAERRYLALKTAATVIQHWYRAMILARKTREEYGALKCSALVIQRVWRGRADRKRLERLHEYATLIQASYRRHRAQALYRSTKLAVVVLQRRFRAYMARKMQRSEYLKLKAAAITLQANFRGMKVRMQLDRRHHAATLIQSVGRMLIWRKRYLLFQSATIIIQSRYRALVEGRVQQFKYRQQRQAAINIQAAYRGFRVRRGLRKQHTAATAIQAHFRMYRVRMMYLATRCAAIIVQERYRAKRLGDQQAQRYMALRSAAVIIQAGYRGHMVRQKLLEMHRAATVIQRWFQASRDRRRFLAIKATALLFQRTYRAVVQTREIRLDYLLRRRAAISLQAAYRGMKARQQLQVLHTAAVKIQSFIRMFLQRTYYKNLCWATTTVQCRYRTNKKMREKMLTLNAAVVLQAAFRGMKTRQGMRQMHQAANAIQLAYRAHCERKMYLALKSSAITLQQRFRANLAAKHQLQQYRQIRGAVILFQAAYRGQRVRKEISRQHQAATVIQASFRKHMEQIKFQAMRLATIVIQRYYRSCVLQRADRRHFLEVRQSAIVLQAAFRGMASRRKRNRMHQAANFIQLAYRAHCERKMYLALKSSAITLQQRFRANLAAKHQLQQYRQIRGAVILFQAAYRGQRVRKEISRQHQAATVIQASFRKHMEQIKFQAMRLATIVIQRYYRSCVLQRTDRRHFLEVRQSAIVLQAAFRGMASRRKTNRMHQAANAIQLAYRAHCERKMYLALKSSAITLQQRFRANLAAKHQLQQYRQIRGAVILFQAAYRGQRVRKEISRQHQAATVIQASFRKHMEQIKFQAMRLATIVIQRYYRSCVLQRADRRHFLEVRQSAIVLQAAFRGMASRRKRNRMHQAANFIQLAYRAHCERKMYLALKSSAITLQQRFRANLAAKHQLQQYRQIRGAVILFQAAYRGQRVRKEISRQHQAATVIQASFRKHMEQIKFQAMRLATIVIQRYYRSCVLQRTDRRHFLEVRQSAIVLQAAFRGMASRRKTNRMHQAANAIQLAYRAHCERKMYLALKSSAITLQQRFRANLAAKHQLQQYRQIRGAVILFQAAYRGQRVRKEISRQHQAATVIQASFRKHMEQIKFQAMRLSTIIIQRYYRSCVLQRADRGHFLKVRQSAIVLQAAFRGHCVRNNISKMQRAATVIQAHYRRYKQQSCFRRWRWAALVVQQRFRAQRLKSLEVKNYRRVRRATITLQAACRGMVSRRKTNQMHRAASTIQRGYRAHCARKQYVAFKSSVLTLQQRFRANLAAKQQLQQYRQIRGAVILFQAAYRGQRVRKEISRQHQAATVIQASFRKHREQIKFQAMRLATIVIQRYYRSCVLQRAYRRHFLKVRQSAIVLQAAFRGMASRRKTNRMHQAANAIQLAYRAHCERKMYLALKSSAITLQQRFRANLAAKHQLQQYRQIRGAVILFQAAYRGQRVRKEISRQHQAATVIQASFRKHMEQIKFQAMRLSTIIIQRYYRSCVLQRADRGHFLKVRQSAIVLQAAFRGHCVRNNISKMHRAATVIQAHYRRYKQQSCFRRWCWAALVVQQRFRAQRLKSLEVKNYRRVRRATITLQAACRGMVSRRKTNQMHRAASTIQRGYRAHCARKQYVAFKSSVLTLQQRFRANLAAKHQLQQYRQIRGAVILFQAAYRGQRVRKEISRQHQAATVIQASFRKHREQIKFQAMRLATIIIQRYYRSCVLQRADRGHFLRVKQSAIILQAAFRGHFIRRAIVEQNHAATMIQSHWRSLVQRRAFQRLREAAMTLQRILRAVWLARATKQHYTRKRRAAITLQAHFRGWIARQQLLEAAKAEKRRRFSAAAFHHISAMKIQRALRAHWALQSAKKDIHSVVTIQRWVRARQQRRRYVEERRKVVTVQRAARQWLARRHQAASVIQHAARSFLLLRRQQRVLQGIIKAQALWRGHRSRKLSDEPRVVAARHRLCQVSAGVQEEDKLGNKTAAALDYLLRYKHFSYILDALKNLEIATRLSPECCERLVERGATLVIFTLIRCCNRSVPCMDVITFSIQILLNLSKYHKTVEAVYAVENSVETLLDLLQRYREKAGNKVADKGGSIFTKACFLLVLLLQDHHRALEVSKLPKALDRIRGIYRLTVRKCQLDTERTIVKHKMNTSTNSGFLVQATPRKSRPARRFAPDWVLKKDTLRDIVDPLGAIKMVADTFSIVL